MLPPPLPWCWVTSRGSAGHLRPGERGGVLAIQSLPGNLEPGGAGVSLGELAYSPWVGAMGEAFSTTLGPGEAAGVSLRSKIKGEKAEAEAEAGT